MDRVGTKVSKTAQEARMMAEGTSLPARVRLVLSASALVRRCAIDLSALLRDCAELRAHA
eukprot:1876078-Pleurochrysis_carterae.AAC.6